jgi:hypothetical protein
MKYNNSYKKILYLLFYLLPPWSRVLLEKLPGFQLVKKFPTFCGTRRFITSFTSARHLSLSWASSSQFYKTRNLYSRKVFEILLGTVDYFRFWPTFIRCLYELKEYCLSGLHPSVTCCVCIDVWRNVAYVCEYVYVCVSVSVSGWTNRFA